MAHDDAPRPWTTDALVARAAPQDEWQTTVVRRAALARVHAASIRQASRGVVERSRRLRGARSS